MPHLLMLTFPAGRLYPMGKEISIWERAIFLANSEWDALMDPSNT
jgi:hypothetical protein